MPKYLRKVKEGLLAGRRRREAPAVVERTLRKEHPQALRAH
ncbi:hypothetical protein [Arthrobacter sp. R4-81]